MEFSPKKAFRDTLDDAGQTISFCAVGAHHQNGLVEREIRTMTEGSRANLLHAQRRWPNAIGPILWPYAWKDFEYKKNRLKLDAAGRSALNKFAKVDVKPDLRDFHPFGCPVFVLDSRLQSGASMIPKWEPRARVGVYLGHSPCHAGSVALVLNPRTLRVSPQFHLVFDDEFSTVPFMTSGTIPPHWSILVQKSATVASADDFNIATSWANDYISQRVPAVAEEDADSSATANLLNGTLHGALDGAHEEQSTNLVHVGTQSGSDEEVPDGTHSSQHEEADEAGGVPTVPARSTTAVSGEATAATEDAVTNPLLFPTMPDLDNLTLRRSSRRRNPSQEARESTSGTVRRMFGLFACFTAISMTVLGACAHGRNIVPEAVSSVQRFALHTERINAHFDGTVNAIHHAILMTEVDSNDVYTMREVMKQPDFPEFIQAMVKEVQDHEEREHWTIVPRSEIPAGTKTILSIRSFKRKRFPDGRINKHKARLCAHRGMQQWGINYWETYSPVVNWLSVRTLMAISIIHDLETRSIDFVLAFPQAEVNVPIFMELPMGFNCDDSRNQVLRLNKNLYGLKDDSLNFFKMLKEGLERCGYEQQSAADACVFLGKSSVVLVYVDDCIIFQNKGSDEADKLIQNLQEGPEKFVFTDDGDLDKYLGVDVKRKKEGSIELTQPHLTERILNQLGMDDAVNPRPTPVTKPLLHKDLEGLPRKYDWSYRRLVGMLTYLQGTTRPDIAMAVHQTARFSINPMLSHERAIQRIGKYLLGSKDKGITFRPDPSKGLECFVDADFAGGWHKGDADNADAVMSRTGYVITYSGCPVHWCSKLQTEVALSTTEAEYIALSQSLREVIPIMELLKELKSIFPINVPTPEVHCKTWVTWEDNNGCLALAQKQKFSPRTKHIAIKYHHFRQHVENGSISIHPIDTKEQTADIFTKPLDESLFIYLRKKLNGW